MSLPLAAIGLLLLSGLGALVGGRSARRATAIGAGGAVAGSVVGLVAALRVLLTGAGPSSLHLNWAVPGGAFAVALDPLSAFFLVPTFFLTALAAIYGSEYLAPFGRHRSLGPAWFFFNGLVASIVLVLIARNAILFLMAWELMSLASFFLVTFEDERAESREAGWTYLIATHAGTACLLALFVLLGRSAGSLDFDAFAIPAGQFPPAAGLIFLLAVVGFGTKAGFVPLHVWLPDAHPAAPSHVSALMSGVMIKVGIYGLVRTLAFLGDPAAWWGFVLVGVGVTSGVFGVLFALAQRDLKRLLAYSSVENIGIIAVGLGAGILGAASGSPALAVLGFAGALLHVVNHAVFKGLLFLGAGAVAHATGTRDIEHLGGLLKRMPRTGVAFLVGAAAVSGLPPLNGFVSEFLIYLGAFRGAAALDAAFALPLLGVIAGLGLIGGLGVACFTKAFGIVFLGEPRSPLTAQARDPGPAMQLPMMLLASACVLMALLSPVLLRGLGPVLDGAAGLSAGVVRENLAEASRPLLLVGFACLGFLALIAVLAVLRGGRTFERSGGDVVTWDCGYARPTPRMQYTASSFAQPLTSLFAPLLRTRCAVSPPRGIFPVAASLATSTPDVVREMAFTPVFGALGRRLSSFRRLQQGRVQVYVLYIVLTLLALLLWQLEHVQ